MKGFGAAGVFVIEAVVGLETGGRRSRRSGFIDPPE
jgi:hypothetical protein